jgi:thioredoxin reductase (NADPH)
VKSRAGLNDGHAQLLETSIPGIFTAGDMHEKSTKQVVSAADEGGSAALIIWEYLKRM